MEQILKLLSPSMLAMVLPMILLKAGNYFKGKDSNNTGADDAFGNILIAAAPAATAALEGGSETAFKKALRVLHTTIGNYLGE